MGVVASGKKNHIITTKIAQINTYTNNTKKSSKIEFTADRLAE